MSTGASRAQTELQWERLSVDDAYALAQIGRQTAVDTFAALNTPENLQYYLDSAFSIPQLASELSNPSNLFYAVKREGVWVGYVKFQTVFDNTTIELPATVLSSPTWRLERFYLDKPWHGTGIAQVMMQFCLDLARKHQVAALWLGVWEHNVRALKFYTKVGFQRVGQFGFKWAMSYSKTM